MSCTLYQIEMLSNAAATRMYYDNHLQLSLTRCAYHAKPKEVDSFIRSMKPDIIRSRPTVVSDQPVKLPEGFDYTKE